MTYFDDSGRAGIDRDKRILDYHAPTDYARMREYLDIFSSRYDFLSLSYLGETMFGRAIPLIKLGNPSAEKAVMYVGAHHGMEWITTTLLLRFINEYCECYTAGRRVYSINMRYFFKSRLIYLIPMLNCDGVDLQINGIAEDHPMRDRLIAMNGGSDDFTHWQANGRGVDLNHNYDAGFDAYKKLEAEAGIDGGAPTRFSGERPESEPETAALSNFLRLDEKIRMILTFHTQGEEIYYTSGGAVAPRSRTIGRLLSKMSGYRLAEPEGMAAYGGLTDWFIEAFNRPSFTLECGRGENPLPLDNFFDIYAAMRELLFTAPILI